LELRPRYKDRHSQKVRWNFRAQVEDSADLKGQYVVTGVHWNIEQATTGANVAIESFPPYTVQQWQLLRCQLTPRSIFLYVCKRRFPIAVQPQMLSGCITWCGPNQKCTRIGIFLGQHKEAF
jgi:hypothetical protein